MAAEDWLTLSVGRLRVCGGVRVCVCVCGCVWVCVGVCEREREREREHVGEGSANVWEQRTLTVGGRSIEWLVSSLNRFDLTKKKLCCLLYRVKLLNSNL